MIVLIGTTVPGTTSALDVDQIPVIDDAGIFGADFGGVEQAVVELGQKGADVRVRTINTYAPYSNLDQYEVDLELNSPSWLGQDSDRKNNLVVIIVSLTERVSGIYYGELWTDELDDEWNRIQTNVMYPYFTQGDYAEGVIAGLGEIGQQIGVAAPAAPTGLTATPGDGRIQLSWTAPADTGGAAIDYYVIYQNGVDVAHVPGTSTTITGLTNGVSYNFAVAAHNSAGTSAMSTVVSSTPQIPPPADLTLPLLLLAVLGIVAAAVIFYLFRRKKAKETAWRQRAVLSKQAAASEINQLMETTQMMEIKVDVTSDKVTLQEAASLRSGVEKANELVSRSSQAYSELAHSAGDPENPKLGAVELENIEKSYQKILADLREAKDAVKEVDGRITGVQQTIEGFKQKAADVSASIEATQSKERTIQDGGFNTDYANDLLLKGQSTLEQANELAAKKDYVEGAKLAEQAGSHVQAASQALDDLPKKKDEVVAAFPALASRIEQVKEKIVDGREIFDRLFDDFAESTWEPVKGNGTEAENRVNWATDALDDARTMSGTERNDWFKTGDLIDKGNGWLTEAESLMQSITQLEANLITARRDAPTEINAAQADIDKAWEYINRYDEDIRESLEEDLRGAERKNERAKQEMQQSRPDYFMVCKEAREANDTADKVLVQARNEHEAAERLRAKAASAQRDASSKVSIAQKYIEDHSRVVKDDARSYMKSALASLKQAGTTKDVNDRISMYLKAESDGERAYALAQKNVNESFEAPKRSTSEPDIGFPGTIPPIFFPDSGQTTTVPQPWGTTRPRTTGPTTVVRGGTTPGWQSSGGSPRGGGSSSWGSASKPTGKRGSRGGGGSSGW